ncbi:MAG TPA: iron donor protein CyaY [Myxococcales bacterium]|nr:iron donor protein CyaY [Myxococcales bacterium]
MDDFGARADATMKKLERAVGAIEGVEADLAGDILTLEFEDGDKFVINSHSAAQQIWVAAALSAMHFGWHEKTGSWRDTKSGAELFTEIGRLLSEKLGESVKVNG